MGTESKELITPNQKLIDLKNYQDLRKQVMDFVGSELKVGVDYGQMFDGAPKASLLKPGAEKVCQLLRIEPVFMADLDTWTMLGSHEGHISYLCFLLTQERKLRALEMLKEMGIEYKREIYQMLAIAEGRGAGSIDEKKTTNDNSLTKIVEKRSLVDAVLRVSGLSEMFTQDGEDGEEKQKPKIEETEKPQEQINLENNIKELLLHELFTGPHEINGHAQNLNSMKQIALEKMRKNQYTMEQLQTVYNLAYQVIEEKKKEIADRNDHLNEQLGDGELPFDKGEKSGCK